MSPIKLTWRVAPPPTGQWASFQRRGWPTAYYQDEHASPAAHITCADDYVPSLVESGKHAELTVYVADWHSSPNGFEWRKLKKRCSTLVEAKNTALMAIRAHPAIWPGSVKK